MQISKVSSLLSLAMKAGKVASGEYMTETSIKKGESFLCIVANDSSKNTKKKFKDMCDYRNIHYIEYGDKDELGRAIGKEFRACLAINDEGFAKAIEKEFFVFKQNGGN